MNIDRRSVGSSHWTHERIVRTGTRVLRTLMGLCRAYDGPPEILAWRAVKYDCLMNDTKLLAAVTVISLN